MFAWPWMSVTVHYEKAWAERIRAEPGVEEDTINEYDENVRNGDYYKSREDDKREAISAAMLQYNLQASLKK